MYVNTKHARGFADLDQEHLGGIPVPKSTTHKEYFGPYMGEHIGGFWSFDPKVGVWDRSDEVEPASYMMPDNLPFRERWALEKNIHFIMSLERPAMPEDCSVVHKASSFLYEGSLFQWVFVPALRRWELLLLEVASPPAAEQE